MVKLSNYKVEVYIPEEYVETLREGLNNAGACRIGNYDHCISVSKVRGFWRPLKGANPFSGSLGEISEGEEAKVEFICPEGSLEQVVKTILRIHPYETPVYYVIPIIDAGG
jgi:hypothetical protein